MRRRGSGTVGRGGEGAARGGGEAHAPCSPSRPEQPRAEPRGGAQKRLRKESLRNPWRALVSLSLASRALSGLLCWSFPLSHFCLGLSISPLSCLPAPPSRLFLYFFLPSFAAPSVLEKGKRRGGEFRSVWKEMTGAGSPQGRSFSWRSPARACALRRQTKCWGLRRRRYKLNPPPGPCIPSWR